jgi:hypothetical protein
VIYDGAALAQGRVVEVNRFLGIEDSNFRGGARIAAGDINGDGLADLVVAAGFGGGPRISAYDGRTLRSGTPRQLFNDFFAFESALRNGTFVSVADINGDGRGDIIVGAGPGGAPRVTVFSAAALMQNQQVQLSNFFAGGTESRGGVRVAALDLDSNGSPDLITGSGSGGNSVLTYQRGELLKATPNFGLALTAPGDPLAGIYVG